MKYILKRTLSFLITAFFVLSLLPPSAKAADGQYVLTSIKLKGSPTAVNVSGTTSATITVSYNTASSVDLSNGLDIYYDTTVYSSASASFPKTSLATIDGPAVEMLVSYQLIGDSSVYTTTYSISIVRGQYTPPTFTGTISKNAIKGNNINFTASDFTQRYSANDGNDIGAILITGINPSFGSMQLNGADYNFKDPVSISEISSGALSFVLTEGGTVSYVVKAYAGTDTSSPIGSVILTIQGVSAPLITGAVTRSTSINSSIVFTASDFSSKCSLNGGTLSSIEITPTNSGFGTWYSGTSAFTGTKSFTATSISTLKFTGTATGTATFTWRVSSEGGLSLSGNGSITVCDALSLTPYIGSNIGRGATWAVSPSHFQYSPDTVPITYVKITAIPAAASGTLTLAASINANSTYGYPAITADTALKNGAIIPYDYLQYLRVNTTPTGTATSLFFSWTATSDTVASSAKWATAVAYTLNFDTTTTISYNTEYNTSVQLVASDFTTAFKSAAGSTLSYVKFKLPSSYYGQLYYKYVSSSSYESTVSASTKYSTGSSDPSISNITFVPYTGYSGTLTIYFTAYDSKGTSYNGHLVITVGSSDAITYTTYKNTPVIINAADISNAFENATGFSLYYVRFTLPSESDGKLYYNYTSASLFDSVVSNNTRYYRYSTPYLSNVSFVPYTDYTGSVTLYYTGYSSDGYTYAGTITILVEENQSVLSYSTSMSTPVSLDVADFSTMFTASTGYALSYIKFTQPSATKGTLYYNYTSSDNYDSQVSSTTKYYKNSSPFISNISFVPYTGFTGIVTIKYTACSTNGYSYSGNFTVTVGEGNISVNYITSMNTPITLDAADFNNEFYSETSSSISYVKFYPPASSTGKLYYNYTSPTNYGSAVTSSSKYYRSSIPYISNITFVPNSAFSGTAEINFTAYSENGDSLSGVMLITVNAKNSEYFSDVDSNYSWAVDSIDLLYENGVISGTDSGTFSPSSNVSRGDFMLMLYRAFDLSATPSGSFSDVNKGNYYYDAVMTAKALGIAGGSGGRFYPSSPITREDAMVLVMRTLEATGKTISGSSSNLNSFKDKDGISDYAVDAVSALVNAKVIYGDNNLVNPKANLTRAEIAVILERVLSIKQ
ncbi:MAG: S-layer homology domain-containing protein [Bacillota bacterium]|nr:S-layer homology domain-containing protein [Bacillota bacterium]